MVHRLLWDSWPVKQLPYIIYPPINKVHHWRLWAGCLRNEGIEPRLRLIWWIEGNIQIAGIFTFITFRANHKNP